MRIKEGYLLRKVGEKSIVVAVGKESLHFNGMIQLNEAGTFLWENLKNENTVEALINALLDKYEIDRETAVSDIENFVIKLREANLLAE